MSAAAAAAWQACHAAHYLVCFDLFWPCVTMSFWLPDPQSWPFHALVLPTLHKNRFIRFQNVNYVHNLVTDKQTNWQVENIMPVWLGAGIKKPLNVEINRFMYCKTYHYVIIKDACMTCNRLFNIQNVCNSHLASKLLQIEQYDQRTDY